MEITTGMSAPPMGMMISTPMAKASSVRSQNAVWDSVHTEPHDDQAPRASTRATALSRMLAREHDGTPETSPCSLVNATTEPEKVMAPMALIPRTSR